MFKEMSESKGHSFRLCVEAAEAAALSKGNAACKFRSPESVEPRLYQQAAMT